MAASQPLVASEILDAYRSRGIAACWMSAAARALPGRGGRAAPALRLHAVRSARGGRAGARAFAAAGLAGRAQAVGGSFLADALPHGADLITLVRVVHDHDDAAVRRLLRAVRAALPPGGTLLLAEPMADTPGAERMGDAYFGFYLLAMGSGRPRSAAELTAMLREAGFGRCARCRTSTPLLTSVLLARRLV